MTINNQSFQNLNFGTKPSTTGFDEIEVMIDPSTMIGDFAKAYEGEIFRRNPVRATQVGITSDELFTYFKGLISIRLESLSPQGCKSWRQAKQLYIPTWIEFVLSCLGIVTDIDMGLKIVPTGKIEYDIDVMLATSNKLQSFIPDGLGLHRDAFPRGTEGDQDMMSFALIDGMIKGMSRNQHPTMSYAAAFLGMKLKEEISFRMLYRVSYDDITFISTMLLHESTLF